MINGNGLTVQRDRLRLCIVTPVHWKAFMGGAQFQLKCLLDYLRTLDRYDIHYVARRVPAERELDGYTIHRIGNSQGMPRFGYSSDFRRLYRVLKELSPDVIYQRIGCAYTGIAAHYARRHDCGFVSHAANDTDVQVGLKVQQSNWIRDRLERALLSHGIRAADTIVTQTEHQAHLLHKNFGRTPEGVIANFQPEPVENISKARPLRVVWVANLKRSKQPDAFLRLARHLRDIQDARFVMIGAGARGSGVTSWHEQLMRDIEAAANVDYLGQLPQDDVNRELARAHVFVNTSLYEGFANTFIQAWMRETAVVSLNVNPDGIFDGDAVGFHAGTEARMAEVVRRLLADAALRERIAARARQHAMQFHSMQNAGRLEELIRHSAQARSRRGAGTARSRRRA